MFGTLGSGNYDMSYTGLCQSHTLHNAIDDRLTLALRHASIADITLS